MIVPKRTLFLIWKNEINPTKKFLAVETHVFANLIDKTKYSKEECSEIHRKLRSFVKMLVEKWKNCCRNLHVFEKQNKDWLDSDLILVETTSSTNVGRKPKEFTECTPKTQVNKISHLVKKSSCEELMVAASVSLYNKGKRSASEIVSMVNSDVEVATKIKKKLCVRPKILINTHLKKLWLFTWTEVLRSTRTN